VIASTGAYLVRVTSPDESTFGDFSSFVVTNPSAKLDQFQSALPLNTARRSLQSAAGRIDSASRFLYAVGGETAQGVPLRTVEASPLDLYGNVGAWFVSNNTMTSGRSGLALVRVDGTVSNRPISYLYALGGTSSTAGTTGTASGTPLDTVERAKILDRFDQPQVEAPAIAYPGGLGRGVWTYQIVAVKDPTVDTDNPGGETLPSDEIFAKLGMAGNVTLTWSSVPGISGYRVYRTAAANGRSLSEVFLADVTRTSTTYTDNGTATPVLSRTDLRPGSPGVWVDLATTASSTRLRHARVNAAATLAKDPSGSRFLYVVGGKGSCTATSSPSLMDCYEYAPIGNDARTGAFVAGASPLASPRQRFGLATLDNTTGPPGYSSSQAFVLASGGDGVTKPQTIEYASVTAGGLLQWQPSPNGSGYSATRDGSRSGVAGGHGFAFFGGSGGTYLNSTNVSGPVVISGATATWPSWSSGSTSLSVPGLGLFGFTVESGYFYFVGGASTDSDAVGDVYQIIY
jgi:hypothetical protein